METTKDSHHNMTISWNCVGHLEKGYSDVRQKLARQPEGDMPEIDANMMIWRIFMSVTMKAAVHLGQDYQDISHTAKNTEEMYGISTIDWNTNPWVTTTELSNCRQQSFSFSLNSALCLGKIAEYPRFRRYHRKSKE